MSLSAVDEAGLPGAIGDDGKFDGGDTASILGNIIALTEDPNERLRFQLMLPYSVIGKHAPRRHPDQSRWYGQEDRFSRDQLIPIICAGIRLGTNTAVEIIFNWHRGRYFLTAWNTRKNGAFDVPDKTPDPTGPEIWALWLRYKRPWWARLVLWLLDMETLVGSVIWRWFKNKRHPSGRYDNRLTRNHMLVSITARKYMPTVTSRLAYWLNDWPNLWNRWKDHCVAVNEYDTYTLFRAALEKI